MVTPRLLPIFKPRTSVPLGEIPAGPLQDGFARRIRYLRVSVTDRCNYRCTYCMPESLGDQLAFAPRAEILSFEEISRLVTIFAGLGVSKVRLTGGEPTVRRNIVELVAMLARIPGIAHVAMTSNGHLLADLAAPLARAGLASINVSVDTLDPARFAQTTGRGDLARVLAGIDAAVAAKLAVKTNAVAIAAINGDELAALCRDAWARGATPRFIEHMPMSSGALYDRGDDHGISARTIRARLEAAFGALAPAEHRAPEAGPARYWRTPAGREVGIISAMTEHFCDDCNRLRLTATGDLHACLGHDDAVSLRDLVRAGGSDAEVTRAIAGAVVGKRAGHTFLETAPTKHMIGIGG